MYKGLFGISIVVACFFLTLSFALWIKPIQKTFKTSADIETIVWFIVYAIFCFLYFGR
jgi:hypothetical protein